MLRIQHEPPVLCRLVTEGLNTRHWRLSWSSPHFMLGMSRESLGSEWPWWLGDLGSDLVNYLLTTLGKLSLDILLQQVFLCCLPPYMQDALAGTTITDHESLGERDDEIMVRPCHQAPSVPCHFSCGWSLWPDGILIWSSPCVSERLLPGHSQFCQATSDCLCCNYKQFFWLPTRADPLMSGIRKTQPCLCNSIDVPGSWDYSAACPRFAKWKDLPGGYRHVAWKSLSSTTLLHAFQLDWILTLLLCLL